MACIQLPPLPKLPPLSAGFGLPALTLPSLPNLGLCCKLNPPKTPPVNLPGIPAIASAVMTTINAGIATVDAVIDQLDTLNLSCPFD